MKSAPAPRAATFTADLQCSADLTRTRRATGTIWETHMSFLASDDGRWRLSVELAWLLLWSALLASALLQVSQVPPRLHHHAFESVIWGGILLGMPISAAVATALFLVAVATTTINEYFGISAPRLSPSVSPSIVVLGYWTAFFVPAILQRWRRLTISGSVVTWWTSRMTRNSTDSEP